MASASSASAPQAPVATLATAKVVQGLNEGKIVASEVGATVTGVNADNIKQYLYELAWAAASGELAANKFSEGVKAAGSAGNGSLAVSLADLLWFLWLELDKPEGKDARGRLVALVKELLNDQLVDRRTLLEYGDNDFLEETGIVPTAAGWRKKEIRINTKMVYFQAKYNLLREESEGFAKLVTLLNQFGKSALTPAVASQLEHDVKSLVGFFDLDPNRVVDLVLEAYAQQPRNDVYLRLMPLFSTDARVHVLGYKFQHYQAEASTPRSLFLVAASLIKAGLVDLEALLPHLTASEDPVNTDASATAAVQSASKLLREAVGKLGSINLAAVGADAKQQAQEAPRVHQLTAATLDLDARAMEAELLEAALANNQRLGLAEALLLVGDWDNATRMLGWLAYLGAQPAAFRGIARALRRLLDEQVAPAYKALFPNGPWGHNLLDAKANPLSSSVPALPARVFELLRMVGIQLAGEEVLFAKIARLTFFWTRFHLARAEQGSETEQADAKAELQKWEEILSRILLPAMTMVPANPAVVMEVWAILQLFPYTTRFRLYAELRALIRQTPLLQAAAKKAEVETKKVLRRLHAPADKKEKKESLSKFGRMLAKAAHANPLAVMQTIVGQVEAYSNMVEPIMDALKYLLPLGYDVLTFAIIDRLASSGRGKLKDDGVSISDWLQSLAVFMGHVCKKYPEGMEITAICQYLANQLKAGESFDLLVLKELVATMTGSTVVNDLSEQQLEAMAGGEILRNEALTYGVARDKARGHQRGAARLLNALQQGPKEQQLALPLLILLAQQRHAIAIQMDSPHMKLIAELYDKCQETVLQYAQFLQGSLSPAAYAAFLPSIRQLSREYGIDNEVILLMWRSIIRRIKPPAETYPEDGEIANGHAMETEEAEAGEVQEEVPAPPAQAYQPPDPALTKGLSWKALLEEVKGLVLSPACWQSITPELFVTFWELTYNDLHVPTKRYEREAANLKSQLNSILDELREWKERENRKRQGYYQAQENERVLRDYNWLAKEMERLKLIMDELPVEQRQQEANAAAVRRRMAREQAQWLPETLPQRRACIIAFIQECIFPRCTFSPEDAVFCALFAARLQELRTPGFHTIFYYDKVVKEMLPMVVCCTDREAQNLGIFMEHTFLQLSEWQRDKELYEKECMASVGFATTFLDMASSSRTRHEEFIKLVAKWQSRLAASFRRALESKEYVPTRNVLLVLSRTVKVYPITRITATALERVVRMVAETDPREDLRTLAKTYQTTLQAQLRPNGRLPAPEPAAKASAAPAPANAPAAAAANGDASDSTRVRKTAAAAVEAGRGLGPAAAPVAARPNKDGRASGKGGAPRSRAGVRRRAGRAAMAVLSRRPMDRLTTRPAGLRRAAAGRGGRAAGAASSARDAGSGSGRGEGVARVRLDEDAGRAASPSGRRMGTPLRPDAPPFTPGSGSAEKASGRSRMAPEAADADRQAKRQRTDKEADAGARSGPSRQGSQALPAERERSHRDRDAAPAAADSQRAQRDRDPATSPGSATRSERRPAPGLLASAIAELVPRDRPRERARDAADARPNGREAEAWASKAEERSRSHDSDRPPASHKAAVGNGAASGRRTERESALGGSAPSKSSSKDAQAGSRPRERERDWDSAAPSAAAVGDSKAGAARSKDRRAGEGADKAAIEFVPSAAAAEAAGTDAGEAAVPTAGSKRRHAVVWEKKESNLKPAEPASLAADIRERGGRFESAASGGLIRGKSGGSAELEAHSREAKRARRAAQAAAAYDDVDAVDVRVDAAEVATGWGRERGEASERGEKDKKEKRGKSKDREGAKAAKEKTKDKSRSKDKAKEPEPGESKRRRAERAGTDAVPEVTLARESSRRKHS
ncbi:hypothetical protein WJX72_011962 [[Myrmecia] bisecta]|uniref:THO complex subunit 2 n=1 Tax=[Myrmecia] bisecta TaxID=41462 RepID=A0AAW1Q5P4_9CHLO